MRRHPSRNPWRHRSSRRPPARGASASDAGVDSAGAGRPGRTTDNAPTNATALGERSHAAHSTPTRAHPLRAGPSASLATPDHALRLARTASWRLILGVTYVLVLHIPALYRRDAGGGEGST